MLEGEFARANEPGWGGELYRDLPLATTSTVTAHLIPYYAWANRGVSEMTVWLPLAAV